MSRDHARRDVCLQSHSFKQLPKAAAIASPSSPSHPRHIATIRFQCCHVGRFSPRLLCRHSQDCAPSKKGRMERRPQKMNVTNPNNANTTNMTTPPATTKPTTCKTASNPKSTTSTTRRRRRRVEKEPPSRLIHYRLICFWNSRTRYSTIPMNSRTGIALEEITRREPQIARGEITRREERLLGACRQVRFRGSRRVRTPLSRH